MTASHRFPPRYAAPGYERVGYCLLAAKTPSGLADDYNKRRGELWGRCQSLRSLPSAEAFERETAALRDMLRDVWTAQGSWDETARRSILAAARWLEQAETEAAAAGLLS